MNKAVRVLLVVFIIFLVIALLLLIAGVYMYNFYVFKTIRVCIGDETDLKVPCNLDKECLAIIQEDSSDFEMLEDMPDFIKEEFEEIIEEIVCCDETCRYKESVFGFSEEIRACKQDEKMIILEIKGKQAWEFYKYIKEN